jgi:hypothetical protein
MYGPMEIDGHACCLGLKILHRDLEERVRQVFLMEGAIFQSRHISNAQEGPTLNVCPLTELVDTYHTSKATKRHERV